MLHPIKHFIIITKHRHQVIRNASHMGIFFHSLRHDLTKYGYTEFHWSMRFFNGHVSPVLGERRVHGNFSYICQHHTRRNPHHWEYWTDFYMGKLILCTMPYKWACEYVCDMLAASKVYDPKDFKSDTALKYFRDRHSHYYMTAATTQFIDWCLGRYASLGWKGLKKNDTKAKYLEITKVNPQFETLINLHPTDDLPNT